MFSITSLSVSWKMSLVQSCCHWSYKMTEAPHLGLSILVLLEASVPGTAILSPLGKWNGACGAMESG